jgi:anaerobic magnesium-protoporphyrin IX monomethyl ester cyclase
MRVLLVYMNNERNVGRGAGYVASAIAAAGHHMEFIDSVYYASAGILRKIIEFKPDLLAISTMSLLYPEAAELCRISKAACPHIPIILGGVHTLIHREHLLDTNPYLDYVCVGEGESAIVEFLAKFDSEERLFVQNIGYRRGGQAVLNPLRPPENLSQLPTFRWDVFRPEEVVVGPDRSLYISLFRGCPYRCTYCCNAIYLNEYGASYLRNRPVDEVLEECKYLKTQYAPFLFYVADEMFLTREAVVREFCEKYPREIGLPFGCMARVEHINDELVRMLKAAGCRRIGMGVECGDEDFRKQRLGRAMSNEMIISAFRTVKRYGIDTCSFNMIGYPFETAGTTRKTVELNKLLRPSIVQVSVFFPFEGTNLYDRCVDSGLINLEAYARQRSYFAESIFKGKKVLRESLRTMIYFNVSPLAHLISWVLPTRLLGPYHMVFTSLRRSRWNWKMVTKKIVLRLKLMLTRKLSTFAR